MVQADGVILNSCVVCTNQTKVKICPRRLILVWCSRMWLEHMTEKGLNSVGAAHNSSRKTIKRETRLPEYSCLRPRMLITLRNRQHAHIASCYAIVSHYGCTVERFFAKPRPNIPVHNDSDLLPHLSADNMRLQYSRNWSIRHVHYAHLWRRSDIDKQLVLVRYLIPTIFIDNWIWFDTRYSILDTFVVNLPKIYKPNVQPSRWSF